MTFCTIQLLRFIAALLVLLFHLGLMNSGNKGVDIFFVISGFIMYQKLFVEVKPRPIQFFVNRLTKIFFLYWITLLLLYFVSPFALNASVVSTMFLLPEHHAIFNVSWTLSFELYFYVLIGTIAYLIPGEYVTRLLLLLILVCTLFTVISLSVPFHVRGISFLIGRSPWEFFLGVTAAFVSRYLLKSFNKTSLLLLSLVSMFFLMLINNLPSAIPLLHPAIYGISTMFLVAFITVYEQKNIIPETISRYFTLLGDASYAIYLLGPVATVLFAGSNVFSNTTVIVVSILGSVFVNQVIELNGLRWCRKMIYKLSASINNTAVY